MFVVAYAQIIRTADRRTAVVSFRGTENTNVVNWLTNAGTRKIDFTGVRVHSGFWRNWKEVWEGDRGVEQHLIVPFKLTEDFEDYEQQNPDIPDDQQDELENIYITGHSLGVPWPCLPGFFCTRNEITTCYGRNFERFTRLASPWWSTATIKTNVSNVLATHCTALCTTMILYLTTLPCARGVLIILARSSNTSPNKP